MIPDYNMMQAQAGMVPPPLMPLQPMGPSPGQMSSMLRQQAMSLQYMTPQASHLFGSAPLSHGGMLSPRIPTLGLGQGMAGRQAGIHEQNHLLGLASGATGVGARMAGMGMAGMFGGPLGILAYEGLGIGQSMQDLGNSVFNPVVNSRASALAFQNASVGRVVGGGNLSASGQGMSMAGSQQVSNALNRFASSGSFQRDTQGMFNRQDLDRITRLSGELGMLDQAQTADQTIREVKKVSKALSAFMKIAEEPDVQRAMQQMARFRGMGFATPEIPLAASNARTFARMAGVSIDQAMAQGQTGAATFQSVGLSGASGFNAGLGAMGAGRMVSAGMSTRMLNMAGGEEGVARTFLNASANAMTLDMMMPAAMRMRNGRMELDQERFREIITNQNMTAGDLARMSADNVRQMGGRSAVDQLLSRRRELQDQMAGSMSPEQLALMPLIQARMIQRQTGSSLTGALQTLGHSEQDAQTMASAASNPEFARNMRQQMQISAQERMAARRDIAEERDSLRGRLSHTVERNITEPIAYTLARFTRPVSNFLADEQDRDEALAMQGGGRARIVRGDSLSSDVTRAAAQDNWRSRNGDVSNQVAFMAGVNRTVAREGLRDEAMSRTFAGQLLGGAHGFGLTRAMRGGDSLRSTVIGASGTQARVADFFGYGPGSEAINAMNEEHIQLGSLLEGPQGSEEQRRAAHRGATRGLGVDASQDARLRAVAAGAVTEYVQSRRSGLGGLGTQNMTASGLQGAIERRLRANGFSASQARAAAQSSAFVQNATSIARETASDADSAAMDSMIATGQEGAAAREGRTSDAIQSATREARQNSLTMITGGNVAMDDDAGRNLGNLVVGEGDQADLRRKLLAAELMARSEDPATRDRGRARIEELRAWAENNGKGEAFRNALSQVRAEVDPMDEETRSRISSNYEGLSVADAETRIEGARSEAERAMAGDQALGLNRTLGDTNANRFRAAGGGAAGVAALRANADSITDANVRNAIVRGEESDEQIAARINRVAESNIGASGGASSVGTGTSRAEGEAMATTESMLESIAEGMEGFPGAVANLNRAASALESAAGNLGGSASIMDVLRAESAAVAATPGMTTSVWGSFFNPFASRT